MNSNKNNKNEPLLGSKDKDGLLNGQNEDEDDEDMSHAADWEFQDGEWRNVRTARSKRQPPNWVVQLFRKRER